MLKVRPTKQSQDELAADVLDPSVPRGIWHIVDVEPCPMWGTAVFDATLDQRGMRVVHIGANVGARPKNQDENLMM